MSAESQGTANFPGIAQLVEASISMVHGISPGTAVLTIAPQVSLPTEVGTLTFGFGGVSLEFPDCKVDYGSFERNSSGEIWRLSIFDRRWQWRFGQISGTYNVWRDNFSLKRGENNTIDTERSPQELATLCLQAMGESDFDVSDLPNETRPSVEWDFDVPAEALASLCDELGCRVVLQLDNRVAVRRVGDGAELDLSSALENALTFDPPERPDAIAVVCGASRYQVDFQLEAVGLEEGDPSSADTLKPIDQLSYQPSGGWRWSDPPYFNQVDAKFKALAQKSVFRYYRIKTPLQVPGYVGPQGNVVDRLEQILPIEDEQISVAAENGQLANLPASVFGVWYPQWNNVTNTAPSLAPAAEPLQGDGGGSLATMYQGPFTVDSARGLVIFEEPVYSNTHPSATGGSGYEVAIGAAQLVLRAACSVRDAETLALDRYVRQRQTGSTFGTPTRYLRHHEIVLTHVPVYSAGYSLASVTTNAADVDPIADHFLDAAEQEYQTTVPQNVRYPGLVWIELDGAIQHVTFQVGTSGATTTAARNNEHLRTVMSFRDRRRIERQREAEADKKKISPRNLARSWKANAYTKSRPRS
jgi:hypothetical protein